MVRPVHSSLRKALTLLLALLMFAALLPTGAAAPEDTPRDFVLTDSMRQGALVTVEDGEVHADQLGAILDPSRFVGEQGIHLAGLVGALRDAVAHQGGLLVPTPASLGSESGGSFHYDGTYRFTLPGGDFDGDGLAEFLDYAIDLSDWSTTISAVDGDGTFLWSHAYPAQDGYYDAFPAYVTDLDGDGIDEVVVTSLRFDEDWNGLCSIVYCAWTMHVNGTWDVDVLEGPNGNVRWTDSTPIDISAEEAGLWALLAYGSTTHLEGTGLFAFPMLGGDADGDSSPDLVVMQIDGEFTVAYGSSIFTRAAVVHATFTTHYRILGSNGQPTLAGNLEPAHDVSFVLPAGDIDGDGLSDLLAVEFMSGSGVVACVLLCTWSEADPFLRLSGLRGTDGSTLWTSEHPNVAVERYFFGATDLTGDGVADPLFVTEPLLTWYGMEAYDGANGDRLYSIPMRGYEPYVPIDDLDGDGGADLVTVYRSGYSTVYVRAVSGATGHPLWMQKVNHPDIDYIEFGAAYGAGDTDGDGAPDLLLNIVGEGTHDWIYVALVLDGTGAIRWTQEGFFMTPGADVDGDGGADPVARHAKWTTGGSTWTTAVASGATGELLWSDVEVFQHRASIYVVSSPDVDGDGSGEVLQSAIAFFDQGAQSRVRAYSGATGAILLEYGAFVYTPPPTYDQDDAGSGGDAGNDFSTALTIPPGNHTGRLDPDAGDTRDFYAVNLSAGDKVRVVMDPGAIDFDLTVYDPDGSFVGGSSGFSVEEIVFTVAKDGPHYVRVNAYEWSAGNYTLSVEVMLPPPPPVVDPRVQNATFEGYFRCGVSALMVQTADLCTRAQSPSASTFAFPVDIGVTGLHVEMRWDDGAVLPAERLRIDWLMPGTGGAEGTSPLVFDTSIDTNSTTHRNAGELQLSVRAGKDQGAVAGQAFEGCVTILYGGAALPEGSCFDA